MTRSSFSGVWVLTCALGACGGAASSVPAPAATEGSEPAGSAVDAVSEPAAASEAAPEMVDPVKVSPEVFKVLKDGERMRAIEAVWQPGQQDHAHGHPPLVAYALTDIHGIAYDDDGTPVSIRIKQGRVFLQAAVLSHAFQNMGKNVAKMIIIELKEGVRAAPMPKDAPNDAISASPDIYEFMGSEPKVKVLLATWQPGQRDVPHGHPAVAAYAITDIQGKLYDKDDNATPVSIEAGTVVFEDPVKFHSFENTGSAPAQMLIVEARK